MLTWPTLDVWCDQVATQLQAALRAQKKKASALHRELLIQGRPVRGSEGSFQNALTPSTKTHHLRMDEFWNVLDMIDSRPIVHAVCRQLGVLVAPVPVDSVSPQSALFGAFAERNGELAETQHLLVSVINRTQALTLDGAREAVLREIYEDFCSSLSLLFNLERVYLEDQLSADGSSAICSQVRYAKLECQVSEIVDELQNQGSNGANLSNRILHAAAESGEPVQLSLPNFLKLMFLDSSRAVANVFVESLGYQLSPLPALDWQFSDQDLIRSYAELELKQADTAERISSALKDRQITQVELSEIYQELVDEHQAQVRLVMSSGVLPQHVKKELL
jgi:hypothetical protein